MQIALCKCGIDMTEHGDLDVLEFGEGPTEFAEGFDHFFDAAGTRHRCEEFIETSTQIFGGEVIKNIYLCPRPAYHKDEGVPCGPLTGEKLW